MEMLPLVWGWMSSTDSTCWLKVQPVGLKATSWSYWPEKRARWSCSFYRRKERKCRKDIKENVSLVRQWFLNLWSPVTIPIIPQLNVHHLWGCAGAAALTLNVICIMGNTWTRAAFQSVVMSFLTCSDSRQHIVLNLSLERHTLDPRTSASAAHKAEKQRNLFTSLAFII